MEVENSDDGVDRGSSSGRLGLVRLFRRGGSGSGSTDSGQSELVVPRVVVIRHVIVVGVSAVVLVVDLLVLLLSVTVVFLLLHKVLFCLLLYRWMIAGGRADIVCEDRIVGSLIGLPRLRMVVCCSSSSRISL